MKLHLASGNPHKVAEFQALADASRARGAEALEIVSADAVGGMPPVVEDTGTFVGNALKKAHALHAQLPAGAWALADDSGLAVEALDGAPGVESAYFAGPQGDSAANLGKLAGLMRDVPADQRAARFVCVLAVIASDGQERVFEGDCPGRLLDTPRGGTGFGYDPLFVPDGYDQTFAELGGEAKNRISHRFQAWAALERGLLGIGTNGAA
jgi:XTP/dITP diphosphohydrolase